ncbi:MAG: creatininase family protein [Proteobacteria bacterium]|nr:creatininase family protein [Pseudomonadota bacterium]
MKGVWLEDLTWPEAKVRFDRDDVVVIPLAAASRAHGKYLPLGTDALIARALGQRLIERLPIVVAPLVGFSAHPTYASLAGSQHLRRETHKQLLQELICGFRAQGARRIALLDIGTSVEEPPGELGEVLVLRAGNKGAAADALIERLDGETASEWETSIVLALAPRSIRSVPSIDPGDPSQPTAFKGERLISAWVDAMAIALEAKWPSLGE